MFAKISVSNNISNFRFAFGKRTSLVENHGIYFGDIFGLSCRTSGCIGQV